MQRGKSYKTKQREIILQTLRQNPKAHVAAEDLVLSLREAGEDVGLATVYRNLDRLVTEGAVLKYTLPGGARACYQYLGHEDGHAPHSHLICTACGGVEHLECDTIARFAAHLQAEHTFRLDLNRTVFYGQCAACAARSSATIPPIGDNTPCKP